MAIQQRILGQPRDLGGGFVVQRVLPSALRQAVGPFLFMDHFRFIQWNFVFSRKERLTQAAREWHAQNMPKVPGETERIELPAALVPK